MKVGFTSGRLIAVDVHIGRGAAGMRRVGFGDGLM